MTTIELVRHAEAVPREQWWGRPDRERPLTAIGKERAAALRRLLAGGDVTLLCSSPHTRCLQTLEPLAEALPLEIVEDDGLAEAATLPVLDGGDAWVASAWMAGRALAVIDRLATEHHGARVVACSHGDIVPAVVAALAGRDGVRVPDVRCAKGGRFTLTFEGGRCVDAVRHPPPAL